MSKPILVIMAAGLGSRYGGLKQIAPVDEQGHILIDYAIYDAIHAGFEKVVCIIKPEMQDEFQEVIGDRIAPFVQLRYAYQQLDRLPDGFAIPEGRIKPWGTAHAVLCAKDEIDAPFAVINADDFYGRTAIAAAYDFLAAPHADNEHAMVGYRIENTLSESGHVARGVCDVSEAGLLRGVIERTHIEPAPGGAIYVEDDGESAFIPAGTIVSMNLWAFQPAILKAIEGYFPAFLRENLPKNPQKCEYFLPIVPNRLVHEGLATVRVLPTMERWYGVTYRDDMPKVHAAIEAMQLGGVYPKALWREAQ